MNKLPTGDELRKLPLRAVVVFAARNADRVSAEYDHASAHPEFEKNRELIREAISLSLSFAAGEEIDSRRADDLEEEMVSAVIASKETKGSRRSATLAANSAYAAISAANTARLSSNSPTQVIDASKTVMAAVTASDTACAAVPLNKQAAIRDFNTLKKLNLGAFPSLGMAVVVTAQGKIGRNMQSQSVTTNSKPSQEEVNETKPAKSVSKTEETITEPQINPKSKETKQSTTTAKKVSFKEDKSKLKDEQQLEHEERNMPKSCEQVVGIHQLYAEEQSKNHELEQIYELQIESIQLELDRIIDEYNELTEKDPSHKNPKLKRTVKKVTDDLGEFKKQVNNYKTQVRDNKKQFQTELERLCHEHEQERSSFEKQIELLTSHLESEEKQSSESEFVEKELIESRDHLKMAEENLQQENGRLEQERSRFEEVRNLFLKETEEFQTEKNKFDKEQEEFLVLKTNLQKDREELDEKHEALEQVHQAIENDREKLEADRAELSLAQQSTSSDTTALQEKIRSLESERTKLLEQADQWNQQGSEDHGDLSEIAGQRKELEDQAKWLKEEKKALQQVAAQLSATFRRYPALLSSY